MIEGTDNNDTIEAVVSSLSSERTLDAADQIDGGKGDDTLKIDMNGNFTGFTGDGFLKNVETVELTAAGTSTRSFAAKNVSGVEEYVLKGTVNLSDLANTDAKISLADRTTNATIGFATDVTKGTSDELTVGLSNVGKKVDTTVTRVEVKAAGIETMNLEANEGDNYIALNGNDATAITVKGAGNLDLNTVGTGVKTFDAAEATGNVAADLTAVATGEKLTSILLGAGNDSISINAGGARANAEINGGDGNDTLKLSTTGATAATVQFNMAGVETVELTGTGTGNLIFSATNTEGLEKVVATNTLAQNATFANLGDVDMSLQVKSSGTTASNTISLDNTGSTSVSFDTPAKDATAKTPSSNTVDVTLSKSNDVNISVAKNVSYGGNITALKADSVTLDIQGALASGGSLNAAAATSVIFSAVANDSTIKLVADKAEELTITGSKKLTLAASSSLKGVQVLTVDGGSLDLKTNGIALADVATLDLSGTGDIELKNLGSGAADHTLTINAAVKSLDVDTITTKDQAITVDAAGVTGAVALGAVDAGKGNVNINVDGTGGNVTLKAITGDSVTIDATGALGAMTYGGDITVGKTLVINGSTLKANNLSGQKIILSGSSLDATLNGGIGADKFVINNGTATADLKVTVKGDLGIGSNTLAITTGSGKDTIDTTGFKAGTAITITAGAGDDTIKLGAANEIVKFASAASANGKDTITGFSVGAGKDVLALGGTTALASSKYAAVSSYQSATLVASKVYVVDFGKAIGTIDFGASGSANFGTLFGSGAFLKAASADTGTFHVIVQGTDKTQILNIENASAAGIVFGEVKLIGTLDGVTNEHVFDHANFAL